MNNKRKIYFIFQEIESWMKEHEGETDLVDTEEDTNVEDATSDDFNKFLEKRIEAVKDN